MTRVHAADQGGTRTLCGRLRIVRPGTPGRPQITEKVPKLSEVTCGSCLRVLESLTPEYRRTLP